MRSLAVVSEVRGKSGLVRLNRPERLNAWDRPMRDEIVRALKQFDADTQLTAIIMTGTGERAFSAGQDLAEAHDFDGERAEEKHYQEAAVEGFDDADGADRYFESG